MTDPTPDPAAAAMLGRLRRIMLGSLLFTVLAVGIVLAIVGYRFSHMEESRASPDLQAELPPGSRVVSTAVSMDRIVVTIARGGETELRLYDLHTLALRGRLRLPPAP